MSDTARRENLCGPPHELTQEGATQMSDRMGSLTAPPRWVFSVFNPIVTFLLAAGVPLGANGILTVPGRKSGRPRSTPVAIIAVAGRRWIWAPFGEVQWVRNRRGAGDRDPHRAPPARRGPGNRAGSDPARRVLSRHPRPARARHSVRGRVHSPRR